MYIYNIETDAWNYGTVLVFYIPIIKYVTYIYSYLNSYIHALLYYSYKGYKIVQKYRELISCGCTIRQYITLIVITIIMP